MTAASNERSCDICGSAKRKLITIENDYPISRCLACGFIYVSRIPDVSSGKVIGEYYSGTEDEIEANRVRYERVSDFLLDEIERQGARGSLLDVGCGYGAFLEKAKSAGWEVYGTDLSEIAVEHARALLGSNRVECSDLTPDIFGGKRFDAINLTNVLEHVPSPTATLKMCRDLLTDDGVLTIRVPNLQLAGLKHHAVRFLEPFGVVPGGEMNYLASPPPSHLSGFTAKTLRRLLVQCGFEPVAVKPSKLSSVVNERLAYRIYESSTDALYQITLRNLNISHTMLAVARQASPKR
jgi:2-polyprenyl-3-methyl-5-hydroxy-6-metoxy-1,4-benzoquinol methylase